MSSVQLAGTGIRTRIWDVVDLMPGRMGRTVRTGYLNQVQSAPSTWRWVLDAIERHDTVRSVVNRALRTTERAFLEIADDDPVGFISTHPFASQALGNLRAQGRLAGPVAGLADWVHGRDDLAPTLARVMDPATRARTQVVAPPGVALALFPAGALIA